MPRLPRITATELLRALGRAGWAIDRQSGSHAQLIHPTKPGLVTVARHSRGTIRPKTPTTILAQASLTVDELRELL